MQSAGKKVRIFKLDIVEWNELGLRLLILPHLAERIGSECACIW